MYSQCFKFSEYITLFLFSIATITAFQQKLNETERAFHISQQNWDEKQQRLINDIIEKDLIIKSCNSEYELLMKERTKLENMLKVCL